MLNAEKYKDRIIEITSDNNDFGMTSNHCLCRCCDICCSECLFTNIKNKDNDKLSHCLVRRLNWLVSEAESDNKILSRQLKDGDLVWAYNDLDQKMLRFYKGYREDLDLFSCYPSGKDSCYFNDELEHYKKVEKYD